MRFATFAALLLLVPFAPATAAGSDFSGPWVAWLCPSGVTRDSGKCSNFVLELHQKDGKLCGAHMFSTAGAAQLDEGAAPSISGDIRDDTATVIAVSGRGTPPARIRAELKLANGMLQWQRLENPSGDYLFPMQTRMTRAKRKTLFAPVFEHELRAACLSMFTIAAEQARTKAAEEKPASRPEEKPAEGGEPR